MSPTDADLSVVNVAQTSVKNGTNLSYGILVLNLGPGSATAVTVTDPIPSGTSYLNSSVCFTGARGSLPVRDQIALYSEQRCCHLPTRQPAAVLAEDLGVDRHTANVQR